jgi:hypothetical protein
MRRPAQALSVLVACVLLTACGAGGDVAGTAATATTSTESAAASLTTGGPSPSSSEGNTSARPTAYPTASPPSRPRPTSATPSSGGNRLRLSDSDRGSTRRVAVGTVVDLSLGSTYWTIDDSARPSVLTALGPESHHPSSTCLPGVGCGTVERAYVTVAAGGVTLTAHRSVCGEAMACTPSDSEFAVHLIVF